MNCENHPGTDGIGRCVSCGHVICQACAVRVGGLMHCKVCVEAGRVVGPQPAQPAGPQMQAYHPYAYGPMGEMGYFQPSPRGPPDPRPLRQGAMGSLICLIFMVPGLIEAFLWYSFVFSHNYSSLTDLGVLNYAFAAFFIVQLLSLLLVARGFNGFYWNYGDPKARSVVPVLYFGVGITLAFEVVFILADVFDWYSLFNSGSMYSYHTSPLGLLSILFPIPLAIVYLFTYFSLRPVRFFLPPGSPTRDLVKVASYLFLCTSIFMIIPWNAIDFLDMPPVGGILEAIAFFLLWRVFLKVPLPAPPQPPYAPGRTP